MDTTNTTAEPDDARGVLRTGARYTAAEVASRWGVSATAVRRWARTGVVPCTRTPSGRVWFGADALPTVEAA